MLVRLLYASRATAPVKPDMLSAIFATSARNNAPLGVTGLLCFSGDVFLQVLEGGRAQVSKLYNRIAHDARHTDVVLLTYDEVDERAFASWSMGQVNLDRLNPALLLKYSETAAFDPYRVSGRVSLAMLEELVASASVSAA